MRILILDDMEIRHEGFRRMLKGTGEHDVVHVFDYDECVAALEGEGFDLIFLDHDLGADRNADFVYAGGDDMDGCCVVDWMIKNLPVEKHPGQVIIHSHNEACGPKMARDLTEGGIPAKHQRFIAPRGAPGFGEPGMA